MLKDCQILVTILFFDFKTHGIEIKKKKIESLFRTLETLM